MTFILGKSCLCNAETNSPAFDDVSAFANSRMNSEMDEGLCSLVYAADYSGWCRAHAVKAWMERFRAIKVEFYWMVNSITWHKHELTDDWSFQNEKELKETSKALSSKSPCCCC